MESFGLLVQELTNTPLLITLSNQPWRLSRWKTVAIMYLNMKSKETCGTTAAGVGDKRVEYEVWQRID